MPPEGFEPTISAGERPQTYALDRTATGTGIECRIFKFPGQIAVTTHAVSEGEWERLSVKRSSHLIVTCSNNEDGNTAGSTDPKCPRSPEHRGFIT